MFFHTKVKSSPDQWNVFLEFTHAYDEGINGLFIKLGNLYYIVRNTEDIRSYVRNTESDLKIEGEYYEFRIGLVGWDDRKVFSVLIMLLQEGEYKEGEYIGNMGATYE